MSRDIRTRSQQEAADVCAATPGPSQPGAKLSQDLRKQQNRTARMNEAFEPNHRLLPADAQPAEVLQPDNRPLDRSAAPARSCIKTAIGADTVATGWRLIPSCGVGLGVSEALAGDPAAPDTSGAPLQVLMRFACSQVSGFGDSFQSPGSYRPPRPSDPRIVIDPRQTRSVRCRYLRRMP